MTYFAAGFINVGFTPFLKTVCNPVVSKRVNSSSHLVGRLLVLLELASSDELRQAMHQGPSDQHNCGFISANLS